MEHMARREICCTFTGHRPEKLTFADITAAGGDPAQAYELLLAMIDRAVNGAINRGYTHFITGMCRGMDLWAAQAVLRAKKIHPHITLEAAVPHLGQEKRWSPQEQAVYRQVFDACDKQTVLGDHYTNGCMQRRNRYMIDRASLLLAVYDPAVSGGTKYTVDYARRHGVQIINLLEKVSDVLTYKPGQKA